MAGKGPVGHARTRSPRAAFLDCTLCRGYRLRIEIKPQVIVGTGKNDSMPIHDGFGGRQTAFSNRAKRHRASLLEIVTHFLVLAKFFEQTHANSGNFIDRVLPRFPERGLL